MSIPPANGRVDAQQDTVVHGAWISRAVSLPYEGTSRSPSQPELKWLTNWLSFLWESESPCRVDDVHGCSLRDSLSPCGVAAHSHSLLQLNIIPPSVSDSAPLAINCSLSHLRVRYCVHLVVWKMTPRTSRAHVLTTSPRLADSDRQKRFFFFLPSFLLRNTDQEVQHESQFSQECLEARRPRSLICVQCFSRFSPSSKHGPRILTCVQVSQVSARDTDQGVEHVQFSHDFHQSGTDGSASARVDVPTARHVLQSGRTKESMTCVQVLFHGSAGI